MTITQEQIAAATDRCRNVKSHLITLKRVNQKVVYGSWLDDAIKLLGEMPNMLEQLAADLLTACKREAAMIARYDAKLEAAELGKVEKVRVRPLVWVSHPVGFVAGAVCGSSYMIDTRSKRPRIIKGLTFWTPVDSLDEAKAAAQADYEARILAALEPALDAPVTVSSTEQDLGALVEHFKAKAENAYADGVRDAEGACKAVSKRFLSPEYSVGQPMASFSERFACGECAAAIRALLTEKHHD